MTAVARVLLLFFQFAPEIGGALLRFWRGPGQALDLGEPPATLKTWKAIDAKIDAEKRAIRMYAAYTASSGGLNYQGKPCPKWDELPPAIQSHWCAAAGVQ
jgi:hypothetical protein